MSNLPTGWTLSPLTEIVDLHDSRRIPLNQRERAERRGPFPYYGANGQVDSIDAYIFDGDYILLAEDGGYFDDRSRAVAYEASGKFWVNNHAHILSPKPGIPRRYLTYALNQVDWMPHVGGSTRLKLTQEGMKKVCLPIAPLRERVRIVSKLDNLFARSKSARQELMRIFRLAERYKQAILAAAFCGELTAEWRRINEPAQQRKVADEVAVLRTEYFKHAKVREKPAFAPSWMPSIEIPETWGWVSVDQLATLVQYGTSAKTSDTVGVPILRMGNITDGKLDYRSLKYLPLNHSEFPELLLTDGDILFNRTNSAELVGKTAVYRDIGHLTSFASYLIRVRVVGYLPDLLSSYINSEYGRAWVSSVVSQQVGQANVNGTKLRELGVPIMSMDEQKQILSHVHRAFAHVGQAVAQTARSAGLLDRLEQAILEKAFRGKLVVAEEGEEQRDTRTETDR